MSTKEQERKALEQIRKIVDGLGENSYVGMAFDGVFEKAEENIENDFGCSFRQEIEQLEKREQALEQACNAEKIKNASLQEDLERLHRNDQSLQNQYNEMRNKNYALQEDYRIQGEALRAAETEIMKLKAKLYDLIVKE